jgi:hypothetical protein
MQHQLVYDASYMAAVAQKRLTACLNYSVRSSPCPAGYNQGAAQLCAEGFYSAGNHRLPCTQCPFGTTTNFASNINSATTNCTQYIAGYGLLNGIPQPCAVAAVSSSLHSRTLALPARPALHL